MVASIHGLGLGGGPLTLDVHALQCPSHLLLVLHAPALPALGPPVLRPVAPAVELAALVEEEDVARVGHLAHEAVFV